MWCMMVWLESVTDIPSIGVQGEPMDLVCAIWGNEGLTLTVKSHLTNSWPLKPLDSTILTCLPLLHSSKIASHHMLVLKPTLNAPCMFCQALCSRLTARPWGRRIQDSHTWLIKKASLDTASKLFASMTSRELWAIPSSVSWQSDLNHSSSHINMRCLATAAGGPDDTVVEKAEKPWDDRLSVQGTVKFMCKATLFMG